MKIGSVGSGRVGGRLGVLWTQKRDVRVGVGTLGEAAAFGDAVLLALSWEVLPVVLPTVGDLSGEVVIDATNRLELGSTTSTGEYLSRLLPDARVVKSFNTIAGDDPAAKSTVGELARDQGFKPLDVGGLDQSTALEALAFAWVSLSRTLGRDFAFRIVQKTPQPAPIIPQF